MKKKSLLLLFLTIPLVACNQGTSLEIPEETPSIIKNALHSLKEKTHIANVHQTVSVFRDDTGGTYQYVDITQEYDNVFTHYYGENERSFARQTSSLYADLDKETGEKIDDTIRTNENQEERYFKNFEDGTVYTEDIDISNKVLHYVAASYDEDTGIYSPIIFDSEFKNPFDYITVRDFEINEDNKTLKLINQKADYIAECYNTIGLNFITDNTVNLDENGRIESIDFVIDDLRGNNYTRKNTFSVEYSYGDDIKVEHYQAFTNDNPELQNALQILKDKKNFTYIKKFCETDDEEEHTIKCYFTEDVVYFHHLETENDTHPYAVGDYIDYKSVLNDDGKYTCYEYTYTSGPSYKWSVCKLSGSSDYIIDDFSGIGPSFMDLDASIFTKIDDNKYQIESLLLPSIGKYFDYGMLGVQSGVFDGSTTKLTITLDNNGEIEVIDASFISEMKQYVLQFTIEDIGTTTIPTWMNDNVPVASY